MMLLMSNSLYKHRIWIFIFYYSYFYFVILYPYSNFAFRTVPRWGIAYISCLAPAPALFRSIYGE